MTLPRWCWLASQGDGGAEAAGVGGLLAAVPSGALSRPGDLRVDVASCDV
jgi:hypothetical protein